MQVRESNDRLNQRAARLERRVKRLMRVNAQLVKERDAARRELLTATIQVDEFRDLMAERGLCGECRRALRSIAFVEFAA